MFVCIQDQQSCALNQLCHPYIIFCRPLLIKDSLPNHMSQIIVKLLHVLSLVLRNKHSPIYGFFCCSVANLLQTIDSPTTSAEALDLLFVGHARCNVLSVVSRHYYICVYELLTIFNALQAIFLTCDKISFLLLYHIYFTVLFAESLDL